MTNTEKQLARIGFAVPRREAACWRAVRLEAPQEAAHRASTGPEPECSRPLRYWRGLLARHPLPSAYRISRIDKA
jgi:hypothetical protein